MEAEALVLVVVQADSLPNCKTKMVLGVASRPVIITMAENFSITSEGGFKKKSLLEEKNQGSDRKARGYERFVNSAKHSGST